MSRRNTRAGKTQRRAERHARNQRREQAAQAAVPAGRHRHVLEVELSRMYCPADELGGECVTWFAEWGPRDDLMGIEDSNEDLHQLVNDLITSARLEWADRYNAGLAIEWEITGDAPPGKTVEDMVSETGLVLPTHITPQSSGPQVGR